MDADFTNISNFDEIAALDNPVAPGPSVESRFGGKASNLARLQTILDGKWSDYRESGFGIPLHYYLEFMKSNHMPSALDPGRQVTYESYLEELFESEEFNTNSSFRFAALKNLRETMRASGTVDEDLVQNLAVKIAVVFGTTSARVRFRSSSNVEDAIEFNGAGLYDSISACAADDLDADTEGPSRCIPVVADEIGIARALKTVWASLWNFRAHEERAFYSIPEHLSAMGVLVNRTFLFEKAMALPSREIPPIPSTAVMLSPCRRVKKALSAPPPGFFPRRMCSRWWTGASCEYSAPCPLL